MTAFKLGYVDIAWEGDGSGRNDMQWGWYDYIRDRVRGLTLLDVGTGLSKIKERLPEAAVTTHEASVECQADIHGDLSDVPDKSFDYVTCFDVIEHVVDYGKLAFNMARIARKAVFVTTPGVEATGNTSPYHFHEFHPWELVQLLEATGMRLEAAWAQQWAGPVEYDGSMPKNLLTGVYEATRGHLLAGRYLHPIATLFIH